MDEKCCGTCKWHQIDVDDKSHKDWVCGNHDSDYYADFTDYGGGCADWECRD